MYNLHTLEYPIILQCNLACDNCNSFSNIGIKGKRTTIEDFTEHLNNWKNIVNPNRFSILGGETLLHKDLDKMLLVARESFPNTSLNLITNGLLLKYNKHLRSILQKINCRLTISVHSKEESYLKELHLNIQEFFDNKVPENKPIKSKVSFGTEFNILGVTVELRNMTDSWTRLYKEGIKPYHDDPVIAHKVCRWARCTQLYRGKLWKCSSIGFLKELIDTIDNKDDWIPYLNMYEPLNNTDSIELKDKWFSSLLHSENICSMCPSDPEKIKNKSINKRLF
jgi:hypothetical protein